MPPKRKYGYRRSGGGKIRRAYVRRRVPYRRTKPSRSFKGGFKKRAMRKKASSSAGARAQLAFKIVPSCTVSLNDFFGIYQRTGRQTHSTVECGDAASLFSVWSDLEIDTTVSHQKLYTRDWTTEVTYTLASNMQVNYKAYFCVARHDVPLLREANGALVAASMDDYFTTGFADFDPAAAAYDIGLTPFNNPRFVNHYKIKKAIKGSLTATRRTLRLTSKLTKPCEHLWVRYLNPGPATGGPLTNCIIGKRGLHRGWLVIFEGEPTNADDGKVGDLPTFTSSAFAIDCVEKTSFNVALVEQNTIQYASTGLQANPVAGTQHLNIYMEASKPLLHNWNTFDINL